MGSQRGRASAEQEEQLNLTMFGFIKGFIQRFNKLNPEKIKTHKAAKQKDRLLNLLSAITGNTDEGHRPTTDSDVIEWMEIAGPLYISAVNNCPTVPAINGSNQMMIDDHSG